MIFVDRGKAPIPAILLSDRAKEAREKIRNLLSTGQEAHLAQLRFTFESPIWQRVKGDLTELFRGKCAYCESRVGDFGYSDIDHFRPRRVDDPMARGRAQHHYAWLGYEWDNLLLACQVCNASKAARFPVRGERAPLLSDVATCRLVEDAHLLDPCFDQPAGHLTFDQHGYCQSLTKRGELTVALLNLNRPALVDERRLAWDQALARAAALIHAIVASRGDDKQKVHDQFRRLLSEESAYTAVTRAALAEFWGRLRENTGIDVRPPWETGSAALAIDQAALNDTIAATTQDADAPKPPPPQPVGAAALAAPDQYPGRERLPPFAHKRIRRIEIRNFRAIEEIDIRIPNGPGGEENAAGALMLLGENATGKSTILHAVALALVGTAEIEAIGLDGEDFLHRRGDWLEPGPDDPPARVNIHFEDESIRTLTVDPMTHKFQGPNVPGVVLLGYGPRRFFTDRHDAKHSLATGARIETLFDPIAVIANPGDWLMTSSNESYAAAIRALREILALPDETFLERPPEDERDTKKVMFQLQGDAVPLDRLSEGYKTLVAMGIDIMREMLRFWPDLETARGVVLIDEIETHLHPRWKMRIVERLRRAMPQVQFIVTTHDPLCLRGMYHGEVQVLYRSKTSRIELIADPPNVRGLTVEQLLTSDLFGLFSTEDSKLEEELIRYVALASKRNRTPAEDAELALQRQASVDRLKLGATPASELVHDAASEYLLRRREAPQQEKATVRRAAIDRVVGLWSSLDTEDADP